MMCHALWHLVHISFPLQQEGNRKKLQSTVFQGNGKFIIIQMNTEEQSSERNNIFLFLHIQWNKTIP